MSELETNCGQSVRPIEAILRREVSICAVCKDDISTNLGRRRILFHLGDQTRGDPTTEVVKQVHDMMSLFANGVLGRQCDLTNCTQGFVESLSAKWCCRKCERMVAVVYKKFQDLQQFYNQYKDCPLSELLNTLSVNNVNSDDMNVENDAENTITIHGVIIEETQLNDECNSINTNTNTIELSESQTLQTLKSLKEKRLVENDSQKDEIKVIKVEEHKSPIADNQRTTRSKTSGLKRSPPPEIVLPKLAKLPKKLKEKKTNKVQTKEDKKDSMVKEEENKSEETKLSETDKQIVSSVYSQYYEGILRAMLTDNKLRNVAISEVGKFISRECLSAGSEVAKMSHSIDTLRMPELKKLIHSSLPSTLHLFSAITGKDKLLNPPIVSIISILIYVLNSHANLFQKMVATLLLSAKCNPSTIEKLHTYKLCIAYETLVSFIDNNTELTQIPKLIKSFQFT